jgi:hypothetical protein
VSSFDFLPKQARKFKWGQNEFFNTNPNHIRFSDLFWRILLYVIEYWSTQFGEEHILPLEGAVCTLVQNVNIAKSPSQSFSDVRVRGLLWSPRTRTLKTLRTRTRTQRVCLFVCLRIYTVKKSTFHKKNPKIQIFLFLNPIIPFINHMHRYLL